MEQPDQHQPPADNQSDDKKTEQSVQNLKAEADNVEGTFDVRGLSAPVRFEVFAILYVK